jgi:signal transduction histidine kinase
MTIADAPDPHTWDRGPRDHGPTMTDVPSSSPIGRRALALDAATALMLAGVGVANAAVSGVWATATNRPMDAVGLVLVAGTGLVLTVRRRWPLATLAAATALTSAYLIVSYPYSLILLSFAVAVYSVARHRPLRVALVASATALPVLLAHLATNDAALSGLVGLAPGTAWVVVPFAIGATRRLAVESAARARSEVIRQHVDDERLHVAQEVHDVVGHGLAAIKMQADIALHVLGRRPEQAQTALEVISRTSSEALDELRATLAVVRRTGMDDARAPAPSLTGLDALRQRIAHAGLQVRLETVGTARPLPASVDLVGYRIVQESLTNVLRHGATATAAVTLHYDDDAVRITVTNATPDGAADGQRSSGLGIAGMRRRVALLGGDFGAGLTGDGRFEVQAHLPAEGPP